MPGHLSPPSSAVNQRGASAGALHHSSAMLAAYQEV